MITEYQMYWLTRLDGIRAMCGGIVGVSIGIAILLTIVYAIAADFYDRDDEAKKTRHRIYKITAFVQVLLVTVAFLAAVSRTFIPTMKEMCAIKVIPMIAASPQLEKLGSVGNNMLDLANEWLQELRPSRHVPAKAEN